MKSVGLKKISLINLSKLPMPRKFALVWLQELAGELSKRKAKNLKFLTKNLTVVFLDTEKAKALNFKFRKKSYATDILSFTDVGENFGELVLCSRVLKKQAKVHKISFKEEFGYLLIHGVLHLLGYEHEMGGIREKEMMTLQDEVFDSLRKTFKLGLK